MLIVMDQLDHSSYPKVSSIVCPVQNQSITKSKAFMHTICLLFFYSFIYLIWIHQCIEALCNALNKEFHKAYLFSNFVHQGPFAGDCARSQLQAIWCSLGLCVLEPQSPQQCIYQQFWYKTTIWPTLIAFKLSTTLYSVLTAIVSSVICLLKNKLQVCNNILLGKSKLMCVTFAFMELNHRARVKEFYINIQNESKQLC